MKKIIFLFSLLHLLNVNAQSYRPTEKQNREIRQIEVEIGGGVVFGASKLNFDNAKSGGMGFGEIRYNFLHLPIDIGVQVAGNVFHRQSDEVRKLGFTSVNYLVVGDYNFRRSKNILFFAGMGLGLASHENAAPIILIGDNSYDIGGSSSSFCLMPRFGIGVELFHHLRVTFNYKLEEKANRHFNISVGVVFGGGRK